MAQTAFKDKAALRLKARTLADSYPALLAEAQRVAAVIAAGVHGRRKAGQGETFWQYRPYNSSDAAHRIDWRRSARGNELFIRDNEWEAANTVYLWQDHSTGMDWHSNKKLPLKSERAAILLLALSHRLMQGGERCAMLGQDKRSRTGRKGLERLFEDFVTSSGTLNDFKSEIKSHSKTIIASDFLGPLDTWHEELSLLAARNTQGILLHIIDPAEQNFPYKGRLQLKMPGLKSVASLIVGRAESAQENYQTRFQRHIDDIDKLATRIGWQVVRHQTDNPSTLALNQLYGFLANEPTGAS